MFGLLTLKDKIEKEINLMSLYLTKYKLMKEISEKIISTKYLEQQIIDLDKSLTDFLQNKEMNPQIDKTDIYNQCGDDENPASIKLVKKVERRK